MPLGHGEVTSRSPCRTAWDRYSARRTVQAVQSCSVLKPRLQRGFFLRGPDWNPTLEGVPLRSRPSGPLCDAAGARDHWTLAAHGPCPNPRDVASHLYRRVDGALDQARLPTVYLVPLPPGLISWADRLPLGDINLSISR